MTSIFRNFRWKEAVPRMAADLVLVYAATALAFMAAVAYQTMIGNRELAEALANNLTLQPSRFVWLLGPIFIAVFLATGLYTQARSTTPKRKAWLIARAVVFSLLVIIALNYLVLRDSAIGRSVVAPVAVFASICLTAARMIKGWLESYYSRKATAEAPSREEPAVLVLGGAGYIGSVLVRELLDRGEKVRVLDSLLYGSEPLDGVLGHPNLDLIVGDCRNIQDVISSMKGVGSVVHLAAIVGDPACEVDRQTTLEVNYAATRMIVEIARAHGVRRFIFASSCSVYGIADDVVDERSPVNPISLYAETKVNSEKALLAAESDSFHPTVLRFATIFGLGYRPRFDLVVNLLSAKAHQEGVITIFNGGQWRPFIHVRDVAKSILTILDAPLQRVGGQVFNVGDSRLNHTLTDVAELIRSLLPNTKIEHIENDDKRNYRVNFDRIRSLGFSATFMLEDGVKEMIHGLSTGAIGDYTNLRYHNQRFIKTAGTHPNKSGLDTEIMAAFSRVPVEAAAE